MRDRPPFLNLPRRPVGRPADRGEAPARPARGLSDETKVVLFLGLVYLAVWPALSLSLLSLMVEGVGAVLPLAPGASADYLSLGTALPAWAGRSLGLLVPLLAALSFLLPARRDGFCRAVLWGARGTCLLSPGVIGVAGLTVPAPFPVALAVGLWQPPYLGLSLRLLAVSLVLVLCLTVLGCGWRRYWRRLASRRGA